MYINGEWVASKSNKTFPVYDPASEEIIAQVPDSNAEDVHRAVAAALGEPAAALEAVLADPACGVQGFLAAGHVCTVVGFEEYHGLASRHRVPIVVLEARVHDGEVVACAHCGVEAKAPAPAVATTTPFGPRIHALAIYLKGFQALSYERLRGLFHDAFGLDVSEGALMNMFIRSHARFKTEADKAKAILRA
jgi:transposase